MQQLFGEGDRSGKKGNSVLRFQMDDQCNGDIKYRLNQERFLLNRVQNEVFVYFAKF